MTQLTVKNHNRDVAGYRYIYPVISRRSGGLSIGINVNTNNACNWGCVYCQVPDLKIGAAPELDIALFESELKQFLDDVLQGDFYQRFNIPLEQQVIKDIAISGNGEPTSLLNFASLIESMLKVVTAANIPNEFQYVLITNGSLIHKAEVQAGLKLLHQQGGQVWFKVDSVSESGRKAINHSAITAQQQLNNLRLSTQCCDTWIQSCLLNYQNVGLISEQEQIDYLTLLQQAPINGVMLYSLARESCQPESAEISSVSLQELEALADKIRGLDIKVKVSL